MILRNPVLQEAKGILDEYQDDYARAFATELSTDKTKINTSYGGEKEYRTVANDYADAIEQYNEALLNIDDAESLEAAKEKFNKIQFAVDQIIQKVPGYSTIFEGFRDELNEAAIKTIELDNALGDGSSDGLKSYADQIKKLGIDDKEFLSSLNDTDSATGRLSKSLVDAAQSAGLIGDSEEEIQKLIGALINAEIITGQLAEQAADTQDAFSIDATPKLDAYAEASETANEGDKYLKMVEVLKKAKEDYDKGLVGTDDFKTAAALFSPTGMDDTANFAENYEKMQEYFDADSASGVQTFLKDLEALNKGYAEFNNETGTWKTHFDDLEQAAKDMGMGFEPFMAVLKRMGDYGATNNFFSNVEEGKNHISELCKELAEEEMTLAKLQQEEPGNQSAIDATQEKINTLKASIQESLGYLDQLVNMQAEDYDAQVTGAKEAYESLAEQREKVLEQGGENADSVAAMIQDQMDALAKNYHLEIDTNGKIVQVKQPETTPEIEIEATLKQSQEERAMEQGWKVPMTETPEEYLQSNPIEIPGEVKVQNPEGLAEEISQNPLRLPVMPEIQPSQDQTQENGAQNTTATVKVSADNTEANEKVQETVSQADDSTGYIKIDGDNKLVKSKADESVNYVNSKTGYINIDAKTDELKSSIDAALSKERFKINVQANVSGGANGGTSEGAPKSQKKTGRGRVNGSPFIHSAKFNDGILGTAYANGTVGEQKDIRALTGELGEELVVRGNRFFTVGKNGAEMVSLKKNDIVFNHQQTKEILSKGYTNSRGRALAQGNARAGAGGNSLKFQGGANSASTKTSDTKSSSTKESKKEAKDFSKVLDWIEVLIERIERKISNLDLTASSVFKKWRKRNKALTSEIKAINQEIDSQNKGYKRYIKEANSVGLSRGWRKKVRKGEVDIETIKDEKLAKKIEDYQTWYEKALDCKDAVKELREKESELYKTKFDNIVKQFDDSLNLIEHKKNMIDEAISQSEEKGYITNIRYYQKLKDIEKENLSSLQEEKKKLTQSLDDAVKSGTIKKKSEAWYEMKTQINDVKLAIEEANTALIKYNNSIRDIQWKVFDLVQEKISHITSESDFLISLMSNDKLYKDNGQLTDEGMSTMGLHGMNYNVNMARADKYQQEINDIDKKLASGVYDKNDEENAIKRRQELLELQREMILAANEEKMAIVDMVREGIEVELDALKELIDTYTEALDSQKDLYDYQKNIKDQVKEIASLEKQMTALAGDTSEENKAKLQQLKVSLEDARENLEETEYDRYISDQKKLLNDIYDEYEEILNQRLDNIDQLVSDMIDDINENAKTIVKTISDEAGAVGAKLSTDMKTVWQANSVSISSVISKYGEQFSSNISSITSILNSIDASLKIAAGISSTDGSGGTGNSGSSGGTGNTSSSGNGSSGNGQSSGIKVTNKGDILGIIESAATFLSNPFSKNPVAEKVNVDLINAKSIISTLKKKKLTAKELKSHSSLFQYIYKKSNGRAITDADILTLGKTIGVKDLPKKASGLKTEHKNKVLKKLKAVGYKKGTKNVPDDGLAWTQEGGGSEVIIRPSDGAVLTPVAQKDLIFNAAATSNLYDFMNNPNTFMQDKLKGLTPVNVSPVLKSVGGDSYNNDFKINVTLPNILNYEQFKRSMQHDGEMGQILKSVTTKESFSSDSIQKYRMNHNKS